MALPLITGPHEMWDQVVEGEGVAPWELNRADCRIGRSSDYGGLGR